MARWFVRVVIIVVKRSHCRERKCVRCIDLSRERERCISVKNVERVSTRLTMEAEMSKDVVVDACRGIHF